MGEKGRPLFTVPSWVLIGKCGRNTEVGKPLFWKLHSKDWFRQKLSLDAKYKKKCWQWARYSHGMQVFSQRVLFSYMEENSNYGVEKLDNTLTESSKFT